MKKTVIECDRCGERIKSPDLVLVLHDQGNHRGPKRASEQLDLCGLCAIALASFLVPLET